MNTKNYFQNNIKIPLTIHLPRDKKVEKLITKAMLLELNLEANDPEVYPFKKVEAVINQYRTGQNLFGFPVALPLTHILMSHGKKSLKESFESFADRQIKEIFFSYKFNKVNIATKINSSVISNGKSKLSLIITRARLPSGSAGKFLSDYNILENPVYYDRGTQSGNNFVVITDSPDLAYENSNSNVEWCAPLDIGDIERCDFSFMKDKKIFLCLIVHSQLNEREVIRRADAVLKKVVADTGNQDITIISFLSSYKNSNYKTYPEHLDKPVFLNYEEFTSVFTNSHYQLPSPTKVSLNNRTIIQPFLQLGTLTVIYGRGDVYKELFACLLASSIQNKLNLFRDWKDTGLATQQVASLTYSCLVENERQLANKLIMSMANSSSLLWEVPAHSETYYHITEETVKSLMIYHVIFIFMHLNDGPCIEKADLLRRLGKTVVIVDIGSKNTTEVNNILKKISVDNLIELSKPKGKSFPHKTKTKLTFRKIFQTAAMFQKSFTFEIDRTEGKEKIRKVHKSKAQWSNGARKENRDLLKERVWKNFKKYPEMKINEVAKSLGITESHVKKFRGELGLSKEQVRTKEKKALKDT